MLSGTAWHMLDDLAEDLATTGALGGEPATGTAADGATDILLVGTDSRSDAQGNPLSTQELALVRTEEVGTANTDTLILVRVPNDGGSATAISIPRDSYVDVPGVGMNKINGAYGTAKGAAMVELVDEQGVDPAVAEQRSTEAGRTTLVGAVQDLTGVTVDHYAEIGLLGFVLLTDAVDGVQVCLNAAVDEPKSGADLPAGLQTLSGPDALSFVRQRDGLPRGDLDRIVRQQVFMASLASEVLSAGTLANPSNLAQLSAAIERSVVIDDGWDVLGFATQLAGLAGGAVRFETIPVVDPTGSNDRGQSIVEVDPDEVRAFVAATLGAGTVDGSSAPVPGVGPSETTVGVANGSGTAGLAAGVSATLVDAGFGRGEVGNADSGVDFSAVLAPAAELGAAQAVAAELGGLPVEPDDTLSAGTVRVVLGADYRGPSADGPRATAEPMATGSTGPPAPAVQADPDPGPAIDARGGPPCVN